MDFICFSVCSEITEENPRSIAVLFHFDIARLLKVNYGMSCLCATACTGKCLCHDDLQTCVLREGAFNTAPQQKYEWD